MCIGIPMQVVSVDGAYTLCEGMGEERRIDTLLVGEQSPGTWLLVFLNSAREVLTPEGAARIRDALLAVNMVMRGEVGVEHLFADLVDREPELPAFLRPDLPEQRSGD